MSQRLRCLLGEEAALSPSTISRLNQKFKAEYDEWRTAKLIDQRFIYIWADGIYVKAGVGTENACVLVVIGVAMDGTKHFLALEEGYRESKESWPRCASEFARARDDSSGLGGR